MKRRGLQNALLILFIFLGFACASRLEASIVDLDPEMMTFFEQLTRKHANNRSKKVGNEILYTYNQSSRNYERTVLFHAASILNPITDAWL